MQIGAIVAEWNPFHNGHQYLVDAAKDRAKDGIIGIMSGNFTQRGQIALVNKWHRTRMALSCGVDLVIELPCPYALSPANLFAKGAIETLHHLTIVSHLFFGTESSDLTFLKAVANLLENETDDFRKELNWHLDKGMSYPAAQAKAIAAILGDNANLTLPNNMLAIEYLRALERLSSPILASGVPRVGVQHHAAKENGIYKSASAIRADILKGNFDKFMPPQSAKILNELEGNTPFLSNNLAAPVILSALKMTDASSLANISEVTEGLENRMIACAQNHHTLEELINAIKTKRYTRTKIERILWKNVLHITKETDVLPPSYIRILGMNERGKSILAAAKGVATLPIVVKTSQLKSDPLFAVEARATSLYGIYDTSLLSEWETSPIIFR